MTREQLSSGGQDALFRKTGNFVGTSDILTGTTTVSIGETEAAGEMVQSSNIGFEFNTAADLIQIYENSTTSELLDEALINDGRTDTGQNVEFNISIDGFSSVNSSDAVGVVLSGSAIVDGSEITIGANSLQSTSRYDVILSNLYAGDGTICIC